MDYLRYRRKQNGFSALAEVLNESNILASLEYGVERSVGFKKAVSLYAQVRCWQVVGLFYDVFRRSIFL